MLYFINYINSFFFLLFTHLLTKNEPYISISNITRLGSLSVTRALSTFIIQSEAHNRETGHCQRNQPKRQHTTNNYRIRHLLEDTCVSSIKISTMRISTAKLSITIIQIEKAEKNFGVIYSVTD